MKLHGVVLPVGVTVTLAILVGLAQGDEGYEVTWYTVDGGGETFSVGAGYKLGRTVGQPDTGTLSGGGYRLNGGFWPTACLEDSYCDDDDVCTLDECIDGWCSNEPHRYGDVNCDPDGVINIFDLLCVLQCFAGNCSCCCINDCDIHPCEGNDTINIFDLLAVLGAFAGNDPCCG